MHFTREPIVESIISARDGYKLVLKNSKATSNSEISTEVVEIVSFSGTIFFRSQDRSKNFLLPATDFEISEVKDSRLVLKNISLEKSSKLQNPARETSAHDISEETSEEVVVSADSDADVASVSSSNNSNQTRLERRRERRRNRRRRHSEDKTSEDKKEGSSEAVIENHQESTDHVDETEQSIPAAAVVIPTLNLIPPPTTLISQTLARYKEKQADVESVVAEVEVQEVQESLPSESQLGPEDLV